MRDSKVGKSVAQQMGAMYLMLAAKTIEKEDSTKANTRQTAPATKIMKQAGGPAHNSTTKPKPTNATNGSGSVTPSLNINVQIHISADASRDQIEQIFQSMGKYLFNKE